MKTENQFPLKTFFVECTKSEAWIQLQVDLFTMDWKLHQWVELLVLLALVRNAVGAKNPIITKAGNKPARKIPNYRVVNWCITGKDEPELHMWPFNQFIPILRRTNRYTPESKNFRYDLRFFEVYTPQRDLGRNGTLLKTVHVMFKAEVKQPARISLKEVWKPFPLEGVIIQANHNPGAIGLPTGQFFTPAGDDVMCLDCDKRFWTRSVACRKRPIIAIEHPTVMIYHHLMPNFDETQKGNLLTKDSVRQEKQSEVHANFRWFSSPCSETRRLEFTILAVKSFVKNEYDIISRGPYEVRVRDQNLQSDYFPSPYFTFYSHRSFCHIHSSADIQVDNEKSFQAIEMSSKFGCCTRFEENPKSPETLTQIKQVRSMSCANISAKNQVPLQILKGKESYFCYFPYPTRKCSRNTDIERADTPYKPCDPCPTPKTTTVEMTTVKKFSLVKRSTHGGLMIMTNFCLQPIVIYIARFYKETFNQHSIKGVKMWYWMHLIGGLLSCSMIYFGYFAGAVAGDEGLLHVILGHAYTFTLIFCYTTSWGRHKNKYINQAAEFVHGSLGYATISLAIACVETAPKLGFIAKLLVYLMIGTQGLFMIIMTCHICSLDRKFGMRPARRHFPTVEARFDEVSVPKSNFRIALLVVFSCITFGLSFASIFYP